MAERSPRMSRNIKQRQTAVPAEATSIPITKEVVIDTIHLGADGQHSLSEAAFLAIAHHADPGVFSYPSESGVTVKVTVAYDDGDNGLESMSESELIEMSKRIHRIQRERRSVVADEA